MKNDPYFSEGVGLSVWEGGKGRKNAEKKLRQPCDDVYFDQYLYFFILAFFFAKKEKKIK